MSALTSLAAMLPDKPSGDPSGALVFGLVTKDYESNGTVAMQADGLPLTEDDLVFASGLRQELKRGQRVLLLRSGDGQTYYALLAME
nr:hypothetical protein [uncultured Agathobaculum sp.]